ncbi:unnamed protein product, partial [Symbiodinium necroappetens]
EEERAVSAEDLQKSGLQDPKEVVMLRKRAGIPEVDADARPSSYALRMSEQVAAACRRMQELEDQLTEKHTDGAVDGFTETLESEMTMLITDIKKETEMSQLRNSNTDPKIGENDAEQPKEASHLMHRLAEMVSAACADVVRASAAARADGHSCEAILKASNAPEKDSEKSLHRLFGVFGLSLPVTISWEVLQLNGKILKIPYLKPSDYLKKLLECYPGCIWSDTNNPEQRCLSFWKAYYQTHPSHAVFKKFSMDQLSHVIPLLVHGDEGTGSKKSPVSIVNWQSVWGHETDKTKHLKSQSCFSDCSACNKYSSKIEKCCKVPDSWPKARDQSFKLTDEDFRELLSQYPTTSSHSFLTRHLVFVLPTYLVKKGPEVLNAALAACARDLKQLFDTGIDVRGIRFHGALLALKGDQKWHAATGRFIRSYNHLADVKNKPICHECLGGGPLFPFEDTSSGARWVETLFESEPWFQAGPLELIPFDEGMPARKYKRDLLHTFKIGLGRDIAGSTICLLARFFGWFDHEGDSLALENRLKRAHSRLVLWASAEGRQLHLRGFTKEFMHLPRVDNFPWTNSKGSDTMVLLQWLYFELSLAAAALEGHRRLDLLRVAKQVCKAGGDVFRLLYSHGLLVPRSCMVVLRDELLR